MLRSSSRLTAALALMLGLAASVPAQADGWKAGAAKVVITPEESMWMAGYGARDHESEGTAQDLWAKALVLEDPNGLRAVLVTLDICGISRPLSNAIRDRIQKAHQLDRKQIVLACSHTHCGPVVGTNLITMYPLDAAQKQRVEDYAVTLRDKVVDVVAHAMQDVAPAQVAWETGRCDFAVNRRNNDQNKVPELRAQARPQWAG